MAVLPFTDLLSLTPKEEVSAGSCRKEIIVVNRPLDVCSDVEIGRVSSSCRLVTLHAGYSSQRHQMGNQINVDLCKDRMHLMDTPRI